jgi:thymidine phosphorylase
MHSEEDKKKKEEVETKNQAEAVFFTTEKMIKESGDKMKPEDKKELEEKNEALKKAKEEGNVENIKKKLEEVNTIAQKIGGFIAWGGGVDIASADDKLIALRHTMSLDPQGMLIASIMAKKFAVGSTEVLIDIPFGEHVKVKTKSAANKLKKRFEKIGKLLGMNVKVILTHGEQPIGNGIGPVLEAIDVMKVLKQEKDRPLDLEEKSLEMAGLIFEMSGTCKKNQGYKLAKQILSSKEALTQMKKIISEQGKSKIKIKKAKQVINYEAPKSGKISFIHNKMISLIARTAGSPSDPYAGVYLHKKTKEKIKKGETLITIQGENKSRVKEAYKILEENFEKTFTIKS